MFLHITYFSSALSLGDTSSLQFRLLTTVSFRYKLALSLLRPLQTECNIILCSSFAYKTHALPRLPCRYT